MAYRVRLLNAAEKQLDRIAKRDRRRIVERIARLGEDPEGPGTAPLRHDLRGYRRLRVGNYRVVYEVGHETVVVLVVTVGGRRHVYDEAQRILHKLREQGQ